ncbi:hypothetical protein HBI81_072700 [Parastagonospora nodorum]|nr:hypothetical protein HBI81_072700 [Parastagonospora nodorum]
MGFATNMEVSALILKALLVIGLCAITKVFYNIFVHPLRSYPGPWLARATIIESQRHNLNGYSHLWLQSLHEKYGPVVRFAPSMLSYIDPTSWKDIYGHKATAFQKAPEFYGKDIFGDPAGIIRADDISHARQRRLVSHAFSDKSLRDQDKLLKGYAAILVDQLAKIAGVPDNETNMLSWYNFIAFDVMADLTFGEDLGQLRNSTYNDWVGSTFYVAKFLALNGIINAWGLAGVLNLIMPASLKAKRDHHKEFVVEKVDRRLAQNTTRPDIWTYVMKKSKDGGETLSTTEMHNNGSTFMGAGTETVATELSGLTYMLLKNPDKMHRLKSEIRGAFKHLDDMTTTKLSQLEYLQACIDEGLRLYPPLPTGTQRVKPVGGAMVCGRWVPSGTLVQTNFYSLQRSPRNFKNPDTFAPERFLPEGAEEYASDRKDGLNPFSFGPKNCVGKNLAYHEMRLVLASVLLHFDLELSPEKGNWMDDQQSFILWAKTPLMVKLKLAT